MTVIDYLQRTTSAIWSPQATNEFGKSLSLDEACDLVITRVQSGGVIYLVGNGGSASVVAHAQNDLLKAANRRAIVFQDVPTLTAFANDGGYDDSQAAPLRRWVEKADMLVAVSSSGRSQNIINAVGVANAKGAFVLTCTGFDAQNYLRQRGHVNFYVPSSNYGHVELTHGVLLHYLTDRLANAA